MKTKLYTSIFLWLAFIILIVSFSLDNQEEELKAVTITKKVVLHAHKEYYDKKLNDAEEYINSSGNNPRDRKVQDTVEMGRILIDSMFENGEIQTEIIMPFLSKHYYNHEGAYSEEEEIRRSLKKYESNNRLLKSVDSFYCYQYAYNKLFDHHDKLWNSGCGFSKSLLNKSSDSTVAFDFMGGIPNYADVHQTTIQFINQKDKKENDWKLSFDKNSTKPIIFQINTYTKTDTIRKRYQIKPQKGKKLKPFEYEEIE